MLIKKKCKLERSLGEKLFLKGDRCNSSKCGLARRPVRPGIHSNVKVGKRKKSSKTEFGRQLNHKQKLRFSYLLSEKQLRKYFDQVKEKDNAPELLLKKIESRLDNIVFRLGLANSRSKARQLVSHGHILVNKKIVKVPSVNIIINDEISLKELSKGKILTDALKLKMKQNILPGWLTFSQEELNGQVKDQPMVEDLRNNFNLQSIVEYYSR
ncbi:30S ribosomal protein S4 [Candidatus Azambacteria bacterium]|nr:30S ribosomal protein S4 [Candidatus Azambacteria bacterium]